VINAKDELQHIVDCMSEEECERALELLHQAGMIRQDDDEPDKPITVIGGK
jgi:hypothetical protein